MYMGKFLTTNEFVNRAKIAHGNKYDYSLVDYDDSKTKIKIICSEHGIFEQKPYSHIQGQGCILCSGINKKTTKEFIESAKKIHGEKFNYDSVVYINSKTKVKILCTEHGFFEQVASDHILGFGCAKCGKVCKLNTEEFIDKSKAVHGDKYDYSKVDYKNMHTKVKIICKKHGLFTQVPHNHLRFAGCPKCNKSKGEKIISWFLDKQNINYIEQKRFSNCKKQIPLPFDFYLPDKNTCIEFHGIQHYGPIKHMGGEKGFKKRQENDLIKRNFCKENNIKLFEISYLDDIISILKTI